MKLNLIVADGVHAGKVIPVLTGEFLIGRDPQCQLRPASPAISKQHCGFFVREEGVFVRDFGSTNGTFVNGEQIAGEREIKEDDLVKVGPLAFKIQIVMPAKVVTKTASKSLDAQADDDMAAMMLLDEESDSSTETTTEQFNAEATTVMEMPALGAKPGEKPDEKKPIQDSSSAAADALSKYFRRPRT